MHASQQWVLAEQICPRLFGRIGQLWLLFVYLRPFQTFYTNKLFTSAGFELRLVE